MSPCPCQGCIQWPLRELSLTSSMKWGTPALASLKHRRGFLQHLRPSKWNGIPTWMMNTGNLQGLGTCTNTFVRTSGSVFPMNGKPWFQNLWIHKTCPEYRFRTNSANPKSKSPPFMKSYEVFIPFNVGNFENHVVIFKDFERSTRFFWFLRWKSSGFGANP